jgi:hypothetical protein
MTVVLGGEASAPVGPAPRGGARPDPSYRPRAILLQPRYEQSGTLRGRTSPVWPAARTAIGARTP